MGTRGTGRLGKRALALFFAAGGVSCGMDVTGPSDLQGPAWQLGSMQTGTSDRFEPEDPSRFTVQFNADGTLAVRADCNQCGGSYTMDGDRLTTGPLICTLVACPTARGQEFAALLDGTTSVDAEDHELEIESAEGSLQLTR